ncbi:hypothetical protein [Actinoplanes sp. L3-i22]|uniref:hypothetical protein n=1 Tax=Actinoplanes sp. L3-i22 TaxID=2836373 RepID=UPI001C7518C9|nr:hypothetical protein [Actinoplanes sp. L3-i22]BCY06972.1 hypothetical protein L3i22_020600 [Actinoplanes sp. L3-i22]
MVGAVIIVLAVWAASVVWFVYLGSAERNPATRTWRFTPVLIMGFAIPLAAAYARADWSTFSSLLVAVLAALAVLTFLLRPARL